MEECKNCVYDTTPVMEKEVIMCKAMGKGKGFPAENINGKCSKRKEFKAAYKANGYFSSPISVSVVE